MQLPAVIAKLERRTARLIEAGQAQEWAREWVIQAAGFILAGG